MLRDKRLEGFVYFTREDCGRFEEYSEINFLSLHRDARGVLLTERRRLYTCCFTTNDLTIS